MASRQGRARSGGIARAASAPMPAALRGDRDERRELLQADIAIKECPAEVAVLSVEARRLPP